MERTTRLFITLAVVLAFISTSTMVSYAERGAGRKRALASSASFGSVNVGTAAPVQTLTYSFSAPATLSAVTVVTNGAAGLDYTDGGSDTCTVGTAYSPGNSCNVTVAFTPSAPGLRSGAASLYAQGSNLPLNVWYVSGIGQSSAVTTDAGTQSTLATLTGGGQASGTAVDGAGNVYVVDNFNSQVFELAAGTFTSKTIVSSGLLNPTAIALDGAGNLYISDTGNNRVVEVPNEQGTLNSADLSVVSISGLGSPSGLTVDGSGDLYVADSTNGNVYEIQAAGAGQLTVVSGLTSPQGVAVDSAGNVYVSGNGQVAEYPSGGGAAIWTVSGFSGLSSLALDASGALYVATSSGAVRVAPGGGSQAPLTNSAINGLATDASANVYLTAGSTAYEINRSLAALTFPTTEYGATSTAQSVTVTNAGNQTLSVSNIAVTPNFTVVPSGGLDCTSSTNLASGLQCLVAAEFKPLATGALTGTVTLTDNALNNSANTQAVQLSGTATKANSNVSVGLTSGANPSTYGQSLTFTATIASDTGLLKRRKGHAKPLAFSGNVTWSANTGCAASQVSGYPATATCTTTSLAAGGDTVTATYAGDANHTAASGSVGQSVNPAAATVTLGNLAQTYTGSPLSPTVTTAPGGLSYSLTGAPDTNPGHYPVTATITDPNYTGTASKTFVINKAAQTITVTTSAPPTATNGSVFTIVASASSGLPITYSSGGSCTNSGATYTINAATGACTVELTQPGNTFFSTAPPFVQTTKIEKPVRPKVSIVGAKPKAKEGTSFTVTASSNEAGFSVSIPTITTSTQSVCSLSNPTTSGTSASVTVTILASSGTCDITATWAANYIYRAASLTKITIAE